MIDTQDKENMHKDFEIKVNERSLNFHTELDLFFANSPLSNDQRAKVEGFIARSYNIGRESKLYRST